MIVKSMNTRKNRKAPRRAQTTLEYIIIVAVVAIAAIIAAALYMKSTSGSTVGTSTQILAADNGYIALSKALPAGVSVSLSPTGSITNVANVIYVDNYPEYPISGAGRSITSATYTGSTGSSVTILPAVGTSVAVNSSTGPVQP